MRIRHHRQLGQDELGAILCRHPEEIDVLADPAVTGSALGASLYIPGTRPGLAEAVRKVVSRGTASVILDLEDSVPAHRAEEALTSVVGALDAVAGDETPPQAALFVRVRSRDQLLVVTDTLGAGRAVLAGFVLPKFEAFQGESLLGQIEDVASEWGRPVLAMPVLESAALIHRETREDELDALVDVLGRHRGTVAAVRLGATDMAGVFGLRRGPRHSVHDVHVIADLIGALVNRIGRRDGTGFRISGTVWEYFDEEFPQLRGSGELMTGLEREVSLDTANGLTGKSVIHPSHVPVVNAMSVVTYEEFEDSTAILGNTESGPGGVIPSPSRNKMNERGPHAYWARSVLERARAFGVSAEGVDTPQLMRVIGRAR